MSQRTNRRILRLAAAQFLAMAGAAHGAEAKAPAADVMDLSLDDLSKVEVKIASINAKPIRSQPAVVSVITAKEIHENGSHDLKDILQQVPGFYFGLDCNTEVGTSFRGTWAYEGKLQLIVDGIEMNEGIYGCFFPLNHYAAENIKQVEIIRGPGSAMFGGTAEMAVISITTKGAEQEGGSVTERVTFNEGSVGTLTTASMGYKVKTDGRVSASLSYADMARSDQRYVGLDGTQYDLRHVTRDTPLELNLGGGWRDLDLRFIYDRYHHQDPLDFGLVPLPSRPNRISDDIIAISAKYDLKPTDWLTVTPKITYKSEQPWNTVGARGNFLEDYDRLDVDLPATFKISDSSSAVVGAHFYTDHTRANDTLGGLGFGLDPKTYFNGKDHVEYSDVAGFAQYDLDTKWVNVTLGGRYEYHSYSGGAFVPRIGLVKAWEKFHIKALYNKSFRTPNVQLIQQRLDPSQAAKNENTTGYELEAGYQLNKNFNLVGNVFFMRTKDLLGYTYVGTVGGYANGRPMSTAGVETELRYNSEAFSAHLGYSFSRATEQGIPFYASVPAEGHLNLAMPEHKINLSGTWHINKSLNWNASGTFVSERGAYVFPDAAAPGKISAEFFLNTLVEYNWKRASVGVGLNNLLDEKQWIAQSYAGGSAPLPLTGRSVYAQVAWRF